jgi:uncharacterized protein YndB with AHSA1/START domain
MALAQLDAAFMTKRYTDLDQSSLRMTRHFEWAPERVFDAWLDQRIASKWP